VARVVAIVGPTASGKSALALRAAEELGAEIVNADALQIYRGLEIGTGKPTPEEQARVPHHLVDVLDPTERFSAGEFARRAAAALSVIGRRGRVALVVGGSGLYLRALLSGIAAVPPVAPDVRRVLADRLRREGLGALRAELERRDPATARRVDPADKQRTLRALEVAIGTGVPISTWVAQRSIRTVPECLWIGLTLPRALLYDRIAARVRRMAESGWLDEVRALLASGVPRDAPALQAIGYADWMRHLDGEIGYEATVERIERATRRYAKRQETWFRRETAVRWLADSDAALAAIRAGVSE